MKVSLERWRCAALALSLSLAACSGLAAAEPYTINVVVPLSGGAAFLGAGEQYAIQQLEKRLAKNGTTLAGRPIKFMFHDDQSSPQTAVQLATQLVRSNPPPAVILGSSIVAMCNAMAPLMRNGPVMYCLSPGIYPAKGSFVFSSSVATRDLASALIRYYRLRGWTKIALITSSDASGQDALKNIKALLASDENKSVELTAEATFNPTDTSAAAQIQRLKGSGPQALIAWSSGASVGTIFRAIGDADWAVPVGTSNSNMTYAQMTQYASFLPAQLYIPSSVWPPEQGLSFGSGIDAAKKSYEEAYVGASVKPDASGTFAWDPTLLIIAALEHLGPDATAVQLRDYINASKDFVGVNGRYDFIADPQRGLDESNVVVTRWNAKDAAWNMVSQPRGIPR